MASGTVIVTGASTGIGEATAHHLATLGFDVLAGVRSEDDAARLRATHVTPLRIDVTDAESIEGAAVDLGDRPLAALVNNAGVAVSAPLEFVPIDEFRRQLEVNLVGQLAVIQAFLPALRAAGGRIVNVSSIGGRVAFPLGGPYHASKFALEAVSDSLRRELRSHGVRVIVIEPGGVRTPIWDKGRETGEALLAGMPPDAEHLYGRQIAALRRETVKIATESGLPPSAVAEVIGRALTARRPRTRYLVGSDAKSRAMLARVLPDRALDALIGRALR